MDISEITKVASRKRVNADAEKLREKVSRETAKIIKLKVAQDTAYWDLKEKLHQLENNHERLQQNMVEVQMQHEAISGQYQDELRLRPDTLNKLASTREICDVLEDYSERLKASLTRCAADQAALCDAYHKSGGLVRELKNKQLRADERNASLVEALEEKVKLTSEHQNQMVQFFSSAKQQADLETSELKAKLEATQHQKEELFHAVGELGRKLDCYMFELNKNDESITNLNSTIENLKYKINELNNMKEKLEKEFKESEDTVAALKQALSNQEAFTRSISEVNNALQEKVSILEDEQATLVGAVKELQGKLEEASSHSENLMNEVIALNEKKVELESIIKEKDELFKNLDLEFKELKTQLSLLETEKEQLNIESAKTLEESNAKSAKIDELLSKGQELENKITELEDIIKQQKEEAEEKQKELILTIEQKDRDLDSKHSTINQLMSDVKSGSDARTRLEGAVQKTRKDLELEKENGKERERKLMKQVEQLEGSVRDKDDELSKQMNIILEMRNEKERLQEKIQTMQNTIDNIQKELTGKAPVHVGDPPELDDNAVMYPTGLKTRMDPPQPPSPKLQKLGDVGSRNKPADHNLESMLFNLLSDSSMDGDSLDPKEVNRRFEALARGDRVSPLPMASLKRKAAGGLKYKNMEDELLPLSQVKNDMKKDRIFFKNKRYEVKGKKK